MRNTGAKIATARRAGAYRLPRYAAGESDDLRLCNCDLAGMTERELLVELCRVRAALGLATDEQLGRVYHHAAGAWRAGRWLLDRELAIGDELRRRARP